MKFTSRLREREEKMKLLSIVALVWISLLLKRAKGEEIGSCGPERSKEFDECFARALMVGKTQTFPKSIREAEKLCS